MSRENDIVSSITYAESKGEKQRHVYGDAEAIELIYGMMAFNATKYKFVADISDKETGEYKGTYEITIRKTK